MSRITVTVAIDVEDDKADELKCMLEKEKLRIVDNSFLNRYDVWDYVYRVNVTDIVKTDC